MQVIKYYLIISTCIYYAVFNFFSNFLRDYLNNIILQWLQKTIINLIKYINANSFTYLKNVILFLKYYS